MFQACQDERDQHGQSKQGKATADEAESDSRPNHLHLVGGSLAFSPGEMGAPEGLAERSDVTWSLWPLRGEQTLGASVEPRRCIRGS